MSQRERFGGCYFVACYGLGKMTYTGLTVSAGGHTHGRRVVHVIEQIQNGRISQSCFLVFFWPILTYCSRFLDIL